MDVQPNESACLIAHAHSWTNSIGTGNSLTPNTVQGDHMCHPRVPSPCGAQREHLCSSQPQAETHTSWLATEAPSPASSISMESLAFKEIASSDVCSTSSVSSTASILPGTTGRHTRVNSGVGPSYTGTEKHSHCGHNSLVHEHGWSSQNHETKGRALTLGWVW